MYLEVDGLHEIRAVPSACDTCAARAQSICAHLHDDVLQALFRLGRTQQLRRGETLLWESDDALVVGNLREGVLKLTASLEDGREQILGLAFPGDFIGRPFAATAGHCVTALSDATLCVFRRSAFEAFAVANPELEHALLLRALDELERARQWMLLLGRKGAGERVATLLLQFATRHCAGDGERIALPISRQQMADLLGLTIETVSRKLSQLKRDGVIHLPDLHSFTVANLEVLEALSGG